MKEFLKIGDLIVAEIKSISSFNGSINLHIRYEKFGKLKNGILINVNSCLIKKMKTHFVEKDGIELIFGLNGFIWICYKNELTEDKMENMAKMRNIIGLLNEHYISLHPSFLFEIFTFTKKYKAKDLLIEENKNILIEKIKNSILSKKRVLNN